MRLVPVAAARNTSAVASAGKRNGGEASGSSSSWTRGRIRTARYGFAFQEGLRDHVWSRKDVWLSRGPHVAATPGAVTGWPGKRACNGAGKPCPHAGKEDGTRD